MTLADLGPGDKGMVLEVSGEDELIARLMEMGLTCGTEVRLVRVAPLGDPVELHVRGYRLSVRKAEVASVTVEAD